MDYQQAASYWQKHDAKTIKMEPELLLQEIRTYMMAHRVCALATGSRDFVRCTPIEYFYVDEKIWIFSEGGLKFKALADNKNVCLSIFENETSFEHLSGMQISGHAEMVEPWSEEYLNMLAYRKIPAENLRKLPNTLYLIKVTPDRIDFLNSAFKKKGYDSRQHLTFSL